MTRIAAKLIRKRRIRILKESGYINDINADTDHGTASGPKFGRWS